MSDTDTTGGDPAGGPAVAAPADQPVGVASVPQPPGLGRTPQGSRHFLELFAGMMATAALFHLLNEQAYLELLIKTPALFVLRDQVAELRRQIAECRALLEAYRREVESW